MFSYSKILNIYEVNNVGFFFTNHTLEYSLYRYIKFQSIFIMKKHT